MNVRMSFLSALTLICAKTFLLVPAVAQTSRLSPGNSSLSSAAQLDFFERRVRPLLVQHCVGCHGPQKQESGLRLDSAAGLRKGGEVLGRVIRPNDLLESPLLTVISHTGELRMPPDKRLSDIQRQILRRWVGSGGTWPAESPSVKRPSRHQAWTRHWANQPLRRQQLPPVEDTRWPAQALDYFVLARLEQEKLSPAVPADRRTWLRRVAYDLTGLPPSHTAMRQFLADQSSTAFERAADRLLASPQYGEKWGRVWLDVARYADTKGYVRLQEQKNYHYAYSYRDYVVQAFNADKPFDQFVIEQLAADLLPPQAVPSGGKKRPLAALGFLVLGRRFTNNLHDIIDDRIDVVSRGLLGLTVTCARCHDHKYDPIPTADYYSLYGIFASAREPAELPTIGSLSPQQAALIHSNDYREQRRKVEQLERRHHQPMLDTLRADTPRYLQRVLAGRKPFLVPLPAAKGEIRQTFVEVWIDYLDKKQGSDKQRPDSVFGAWHALNRLDAQDFPRRVPGVLTNLKNANRHVIAALQHAQPKSMSDVARIYGQLLLDVHQRHQQSLASSTDDATEESDGDGGDMDRRQLWQVLYGDDSPFAMTPKEAAALYLYDAEVNRDLSTAHNVWEGWLVSRGNAPDRAHVLFDAPVPHQPRIFIRGNPNRAGPTVPRRLPLAIATDARTAFPGSGRLQLARAIADSDNPLTPRVLVNRVWLRHFGRGLVDSPSNFGLRSRRPAHAPLLDHLAWHFVRDGWSIKKLHKRIVVSSTYRQSSRDNPVARLRDPDNQLLWHSRRRRLDFEEMRDSMLWSAGNLDGTMGGPSSSLFETGQQRRTIYARLDRFDLPTALQMFDFPSPDTHSPLRSQTTVPQQSLFLLNHPFVLEQAATIARRSSAWVHSGASTRAGSDHAHTNNKTNSPNNNKLLRIPTANDNVARARYIYWSIFGRLPTPLELESAARFAEDEDSWSELAQVLLISNEFLYID